VKFDENDDLQGRNSRNLTVCMVGGRFNARDMLNLRICVVGIASISNMGSHQLTIHCSYRAVAKAVSNQAKFRQNSGIFKAAMHIFRTEAAIHFRI
jgi:hypothetical protein